MTTAIIYHMHHTSKEYRGDKRRPGGSLGPLSFRRSMPSLYQGYSQPCEHDTSDEGRNKGVMELTMEPALRRPLMMRREGPDMEQEYFRKAILDMTGLILHHMYLMPKECIPRITCTGMCHRSQKSKKPLDRGFSQRAYCVAELFSSFSFPVSLSSLFRVVRVRPTQSYKYIYI